MVVYISMGFGNPYGDPWNVDIVGQWTERLSEMGVKIVSLSDTIGSSNPDNIKYLFSNLIPLYPNIEFGAHLHTVANSWFEKMMQLTKQDVDGLMGLFKVLAVAPWQRMNLPEICQLKNCYPILLQKNVMV